MPRLKLRAIIFFINKMFILTILLLFFSRDSYTSIITLKWSLKTLKKD